ncbi:MAG TPA: sugar ABC transporter substrate-binding protein [Armatimonadota bacterium]|jgi:multiple sugar transport system substrate-binding protein
MKPSPRAASALTLVALTAGILAGCGGGKTPAAAGKTLKFLSMDYDPASSARQKAIVDAFNRANPDEMVELDITNWNDGHQKLQTLISGNQAPDLAVVGTRWMNEYAASNLLADLSQMDQKGLKASEFIGPVLDTGKVGGKQVGLPCAASVRGLYYNEEMLAKAGVKPPKTWADLLAIAPKIQAANPGVHAIGIQGKEVETDLYYFYFLWGAGGDILDASGKCALTSPAAKEALAFELGLVKSGYCEPQPTGYNRENLQDLFKAKKIAMTITGPWFAGMLRKDVPDLKFGVALIPGKTGSVAPAVTDVMVMFNKSANKDLAWKFLAFWYKDENRAAWDKDSGMLPEKQTVADLPESKSDKTRDFFTQALPKGKYVPTHPRWEQMSSAISSAIQSALIGQTPPDAALQKACTEVNGMR